MSRAHEDPARPTGETSTAALCANVAAWRYEQLPETVVRTLERLTLDALAVIAGAAKAPGIAELNTRMARWEKVGSATGLIGARRFSPPTAALVNGAAAHALDFDDVHDDARVHSMCVVLPAVLATAEDLGGVSGRDFIRALAIGVELHARLGLACHDCVPLGWHPTALLASLPASMAAASLLGLPAEGLQDAFGLAYHQGGGTIQCSLDGALAKRVGPGFAARAAVLSAFLAADGITGPKLSLEGKAGLFPLYMRGRCAPEILFDGLGSRWHIEEYSLKPYPACRCSHAAIGIGVSLHDEGIDPASVREVEIRLSQSNWTLVGAAYDASRDSVAHAQFSAAYGFAQALVHREVGLRAYARPSITDPAAVDFARRIRVVADPAMPPGAIAPAVVELKLADGRIIVRETTTLKGDADEPMTEDEAMQKLRDCFAFGLDAPAAAADRVAATVRDLERASDAAAALCAAFAAATRT